MPQFQPQAPISYGSWLGAWTRHYFTKFGVPAILAVALVFGVMYALRLMNHTVVGNWETTGSGAQETWVLNKDGTGWVFESEGNAGRDYDISWTLDKEGKRLTLRRRDNSQPTVFGYGISSDGNQLTVRKDDIVFRFERLDGDPPPRPAHVAQPQGGGRLFPPDGSQPGGM